MDQLDEMKRQAAAEQLGVSSEELAAWTAAAAGEGTAAEDAGSGDAESAESGEDAGSTISEEARTRLEDIDSIAGGMSDEDVVAYYLEKHPDLKGCFGTNADTVLLAANAVSDMENSENIAVMGFDAGTDQIAALEDGGIDGLVVQNPFGMGYATVVAAARTVLEIGNEAQVDTGYTWVDRDNMETEEVQAMLYE